MTSNYSWKKRSRIESPSSFFFKINDISGTAGPWGISFRSPQLDDVSSFVAAAEEQGAKSPKFGAEDS